MNFLLPQYLVFIQSESKENGNNKIIKNGINWVNNKESPQKERWNKKYKHKKEKKVQEKSKIYLN